MNDAQKIESSTPFFDVQAQMERIDPLTTEDVTEFANLLNGENVSGVYLTLSKYYGDCEIIDKNTYYQRHTETEIHSDTIEHAMDAFLKLGEAYKIQKLLVYVDGPTKDISLYHYIIDVMGRSVEIGLRTPDAILLPTLALCRKKWIREVKLS